MGASLAVPAPVETPHALRVAPLHRTAAWLGILQDADRAVLAAHGRTSWAWLDESPSPSR